MQNKLVSQDSNNSKDSSHIANGFVFVLICTIYGLGANYFFGIIIARTLGPEDFGIYAIAIAIFNILSVISLMGLDNAALHFLPTLRIANKYGKEKVFANTLLIIGLILSFTLALILFLLAKIIALDIFQLPSLSTMLESLSFAIPAYVITVVLLAILQAGHEYRKRMAVKYVIEPTVKIGLLITLFYVGLNLSAVTIAIISSAWISVVIGAFLVINKYKAISQETFVPEHNFNSRQIMKYCYPLLISSFFLMLSTKSDVLMIGYFFSAELSGIYSAAFLTASIISILLFSVETITSPIFTESIKSKNTLKLLETYQLSLKWVSVLSIPLVLALCNYSEYVLGIFGTEYLIAEDVLLIMVIGQLINNATGSANSILLMSGYSKLVMAYSLIYSLLLILLNLVLIPLLGLYGAAISVLAAGLLINVLRILKVYQIFGVFPYSKEMSGMFILMIFISIFSISMNGLLDIEYEILLFIVTILVYFYMYVRFCANYEEKQIVKNKLTRLLPLLKRA